jgi:hypothetical protein
MLEEIKRGGFRLKKPEEKKVEEKKISDDNKTFVSSNNILGSTPERASSREMGICQQEASCQLTQQQKTEHEKVLRRFGQQV